MVSRYRKMLNVTANPREKVERKCWCPGGRPSDTVPALVAYLYTQVECASPRVACSYQQSLKTCFHCSQDPGSVCLMSKPLGSLQFCYFHGVPPEEREVVSTYPTHSRGPCCSFWISFVSEWKKIPLGHTVLPSGAEVSIERILLPFNPIYSFSSTLNARLHRGYALIKPETHEMEKSRLPKKETEKYMNTYI